MRRCHQQTVDHLDGCRSASFGHSLWGVEGLESPRRLLRTEPPHPSEKRLPDRAFLLPGPLKGRDSRKRSGTLGSVRRILAVVAISLICLTACGSDPLDGCFKETAGNLNCSTMNLSEVNLSGVNLSGANLSGVNFYRANLKGANLEGANLKTANLTRATLTGVNLRGANLERAYLIETILRGANLEGVNLRSATLTGTTFEGANLEGATLQGAVGDYWTVWPEGFDLEASGVVIK